MLHIKLLCVGKLKERYFSAAAAEYLKRLGAYARVEVEELPDSHLPALPSEAETAAALEREAESLRLRIPKDALVVAMCIEGRQLDSKQLSDFVQLCAVNGRNRLCFLIGGSLGLAESVKQAADLQLSMSSMTFPHHLARIMLLEQLYRAFKIAEGGKYHK